MTIKKELLGAGLEGLFNLLEKYLNLFGGTRPYSCQCCWRGGGFISSHCDWNGVEGSNLRGKPRLLRGAKIQLIDLSVFPTPLAMTFSSFLPAILTPVS